jgi:hypothetical protein
MEKPFSWKYELRSKLVDGVLPGVALYLLVMMLAMAAGPIRAIVGGLGSLLLAVSLLAVGMFSLNRALASSLAEPTRAWYGMAAGTLVWSVASMMLTMDGITVYGLSSVILLIMGGLVAAQLWRENLSTGGRFFMVTFLLQWGAAVLANYLNWMADQIALQDWVQRSWGWVVLAAAVMVFGWMMVRSETRLQRSGAALLVVNLLFFAFALGMG